MAARARRAACRELFASLDRCEGILAKQRYIAGDVLTEADIRLFMWGWTALGGAPGGRGAVDHWPGGALSRGAGCLRLRVEQRRRRRCLPL